MSEDREILIKLVEKVDHIKEGVDWLRNSDKTQWEKISAIETKAEGHDKTLGFLTTGFWGLITTAGGYLVWLLQK